VTVTVSVVFEVSVVVATEFGGGVGARIDGDQSIRSPLSVT
jgi:hypothetical protein